MAEIFLGYVCQNPLTSWRQVLEYTLIVEHSHGCLFTISEVAGFIWKSVATWTHTDQVIKAVQNEYDIDDETVTNDVLSFVQLLIAQGLLITLPSEFKTNANSCSMPSEPFVGSKNRIPIEVKDLCEKHNIPIITYFEITRNCNLRCKHCYNDKQQTCELNTNEIKIVLDDLAELGCLDLVLTGGEPCCRPDLEDILWHAKEKHFCITLKSNGTLIDRKIARLLKNVLVSEVHISLYSLKPEEHEVITQISRSLSKTIEGIENLLQENIKIRISTPLTKHNCFSVRGVKNFADGIGASCGFDPIITARVDGSRAPVELRIDSCDWQKLLQEGLLSDIIYPNIVNINDTSSIKPEEKDTLSDDYRLCGAGSCSVAITAFGDVVPCICLPITIGNVLNDSILNIWNHKAWQPIRTLTSKLYTDCVDCNLIKYCPRCPGIIFSETGELTRAASVLCTTASFIAASR